MMLFYSGILTVLILTTVKMQIENKIALVTGGANGLGLAFTKELLRNGASHVAILDLKDSNGEMSQNKLNEEFGAEKVIFFVCDVTKAEELEAGFANTVQEFGGLDIVINNAGIMDDARWELMININVTAVVRGTILGMQYMGKDKGGKGGVIVNSSSIFGLGTSTPFPIYSATKHAVIGLSRSYAMPYHNEKTGVRVLTLCPGKTDTDLVIKAGPHRLLDPVDVEQLIKHGSELSGQKVDIVAHGMIYIITFAQNGTIWVVEGGEPIYEVSIPNHDELKVKD